MVTKNYIRGVPQSAVLISIGQTDGAIEYLRRDGVHVNGLAAPFTLYEDIGGSSPLPNDSYELKSLDVEWTDRESIANGGTGKSIYSQWQVTDPTYYNIDLYASFQDFGTYTDNDAPYSRLGGALAISASGTIVPSTGYIRQIVTVDTSSGAVSLTVDPPEFIGQDIYILCDGAGLVDVDFDGKLATGNVNISDKLMLRLTAKSLTEWSVVNEVTADYTNGSEITQWSSGKMSQIRRRSISASTTHTFDVPYVATPKMLLTPSGSVGVPRILTYESESSTQVTLHMMTQTGAGVTANGTVYSEGFY